MEKTTQEPKPIDESREIPALVLIFWPLIGLGDAIRLFDREEFEKYGDDLGSTGITS